VTDAEREVIRRFLATRTITTQAPSAGSAELISTYRQYCADLALATVPHEQFIHEVLSAGCTYQRDPETGRYFWFLALVSSVACAPPLEEGNQRKSAIRRQLDVMRNETFAAVCSLRAEGKHRLANESIRAYCEILSESREEFPSDSLLGEGADVSLPGMDELPADPGSMDHVTAQA